MNAHLLRAKMEEKQTNQEKLAFKVKMSKNSLSRKMTGKRQFRLGEMIDICKELDITDSQEIHRIFFAPDVPFTQREEA